MFRAPHPGLVATGACVSGAVISETRTVNCCWTVIVPSLTSISTLWRPTSIASGLPENVASPFSPGIISIQVGKEGADIERTSPSISAALNKYSYRVPGVTTVSGAEAITGGSLTGSTVITTNADDDNPSGSRMVYVNESVPKKSDLGKYVTELSS